MSTSHRQGTEGKSGISINVNGSVSGNIIVGNDNQVATKSRQHRDNRHKIPKTGELLPFVNREDELKFIAADQSPAYHFIDAPAGFGKTTLLKRLKNFYEKENWLCGLTSTHNAKEASNLAASLAKQFNLGEEDITNGRDLALAILSERGEEFAKNKKKGIILFIDIEKTWSETPDFVQKLFREFIPAMADALFWKNFRKEQHNPFRVVVAGHYLQRGGISWGPINPVKHLLSPFTYNHIYETVKSFLPKDLQRLNQLTAHLMYYTAGHPGCIARTLTLYKQENYPEPDSFFVNYHKQILSEIIYPETDILRLEIEPEMRRIYDELSIFRFIDISILRDMLKKSKHPFFEDEYDLEDRLRSAYLMESWAEGHFLRDGITRDLLFLRFLSENGDAIFAKECQNAQKLCQEKLENPSTQLPEKWLMEYFYQFLQQHVGDIQKRDERLNIRNIFLKQIVPRGFEIFAAQREAKDHTMAIKKTLQDDWKLEFTTNYFLRDSDYTEQTDESPYNLMRAKLLELAKPPQRERRMPNVEK